MDDAFTIASCTLPTAEQPFRADEFDTFVRAAVRSAEPVASTTLRLRLVPTPEVAAQVAHLMTRETACCGFFTFVLTARADELTLEVSVPDRRRDVLDAIARRIPHEVRP